MDGPRMHLFAVFLVPLLAGQTGPSHRRVRRRLVSGLLAAPGVVATQAVAAAQDPFTDADFVHLQSGTFQMGSTTRANEQPVHTVTLTRGFYMQKTQVTQAQWEAVMGSNPSRHTECPTCPVEHVTYVNAQAFIAELNSRSPGKKYRLPTEAEWEYAARAGTTGDYGTPGHVTFRDRLDSTLENATHPVGQLGPNAWGLFDMEDNAWEWVSDWYGPYASGPITDPTGPVSGGSRVLRGGSCRDGAVLARSAARCAYGPEVPRRG